MINVNCTFPVFYAWLQHFTTSDGERTTKARFDTLQEFVQSTCTGCAVIADGRGAIIEGADGPIFSGAKVISGVNFILDKLIKHFETGMNNISSTYSEEHKQNAVAILTDNGVQYIDRLHMDYLDKVDMDALAKYKTMVDSIKERKIQKMHNVTLIKMVNEIGGGLTVIKPDPKYLGHSIVYENEVIFHSTNMFELAKKFIRYVDIFIELGEYLNGNIPNPPEAFEGTMVYKCSGDEEIVKLEQCDSDYDGNAEAVPPSEDTQVTKINAWETVARLKFINFNRLDFWADLLNTRQANKTATIQKDMLVVLCKDLAKDLTIEIGEPNEGNALIDKDKLIDTFPTLFSLGKYVVDRAQSMKEKYSDHIDQSTLTVMDMGSFNLSELVNQKDYAVQEINKIISELEETTNMHVTLQVIDGKPSLQLYV